MHAITVRLKIFLAVFLVLIVVGTAGFMHIEKKSLVDAAYYVIVTVATVGYGDIHPTTDAGKVFAVVLIILGVGTFLGVIANVTEIVLARREIQGRLEKLNMVIGVFFSEVGVRLMTLFGRSDRELDNIRSSLVVSTNWTDEEFAAAAGNLRKYDYGVEMDLIDLEFLKDFLCGKRDFLVRLLENPILLEHQSFTDLLRAVFHVTEELAYRDEVRDIPVTDRNHVANDIQRAYSLLVNQWLDYMKHLKSNYPFLFHLAMRTNPFDRTASITVS
ncbi:MAG: voltage-gated potassium channel [Syntrophorhabdus sp. PtaU1.Bin153]|nr:MAG: voltage-gated potassium channel [Syntrophorhabdus sp. PtaU1.Bin153]